MTVERFESPRAKQERERQDRYASFESLMELVDQGELELETVISLSAIVRAVEPQS